MLLLTRTYSFFSSETAKAAVKATRKRERMKDGEKSKSPEGSGRFYRKKELSVWRWEKNSFNQAGSKEIKLG
jgi:hypothetical protein